MLTITPLGSCRIAAPLRLARGEFGFEINLTRNYGYCHTSSEAVQMMHVLHGHEGPDGDLWPLVSRSAERDRILNETHQASDFYIVELSSAKQIKIGTTCIQLNYLTNHFRDFFADPSRARAFWSAVRTADQDHIDRMLADCWSKDLDQRRHCDILRRARMTLVSEQDLRRDVRLLMDGLTNVLFVTHVNAKTPKGRVIPSRDAYIKLVEHVVIDEGGQVYNPTQTMERLGQSVAIEDDSTSLAHFTDTFARQVFEDWFELAIRLVIDGIVGRQGSAAVQSHLVPHVEALLNHERTIGLTGRLTVLSNLLPHDDDLTKLHIKTLAADGDEAKALSLIHQGAVEDSPEIERLQLDLSLALGRMFDADCILRRLCRKRIIDDCFLLSPAEKLAKAGHIEAASLVFDRMLATEQETKKITSTLYALDQPLRIKIFSSLSQQARSTLAHELTLAQAARLALETNDARLLDILRQRAVNSDANDLSSLISDLTDQGHRERASTLIEAWRNHRQLATIKDAAQKTVLDQWLESSRKEISRAKRISVLCDILRADPKHKQARIDIRQMRNDVRIEARKLYADGDIDGLLELEQDIAALPNPIIEPLVFAMRLYYKKLQFQDAMQCASRTLELDIKRLDARRILMRSAHRTGDYISADKAARIILEKTDSNMHELQLEAKQVLAKNAARALRASRKEENPEIKLSLLRVAQEDEAVHARAQRDIIALEKRLLSQVRDLERNGDTQFVAFAEMAISLFPGCESILRSLARHFERQRDFLPAAKYWTRLVAVDPNNDIYQQKMHRCRKHADRAARSAPCDVRA